MVLLKADTLRVLHANKRTNLCSIRYQRLAAAAVQAVDIIDDATVQG